MDFERGEITQKQSHEELLQEVRSLLLARLDDEKAGKVDHAGELGNDKGHLEEIKTALDNGEEPTDEDLRFMDGIFHDRLPSPDELKAYYVPAFSRGGISQLLASYLVKEIGRRYKEH